MTPPQTGKIYLPIAFMSMYGADFGDTYIIEAEEDVFEYEVSGFVEDITQINMISIGEHNVYLNSVDFSEFEKKCEEERENVDETESLLTDYLNEYNYTYTLHLNIADEYGNYNTDKLFQSIGCPVYVINPFFTAMMICLCILHPSFPIWYYWLFWFLL